ncbi:PTS lactose/cellobiose transporter subunit IIA [Alkalibacterium sp. 20]|uniref:PTS lactose/cellobiose transporter subunit IIA n=1 Tax=Alkalibacterium sp. 20 TaxID=1798803 RepID=UPI0009002543|nr:PTS lactose/cellobiose transporter subunit IIA [Alkalibacterium sp. 20]OJF93819.1 PTS mannose transporter subunit IIA [Alkalibacterium sp. 20]
MPERRDQMMEIAMTLIMHGGDARSSAMEAIHAAKVDKFNLAEEKIRDADAAIKKAHRVQTDLLTQEASGETVEINLLLVHAQDHLMNAMTYRDMAEEMIDLYKRL